MSKDDDTPMMEDDDKQVLSDYEDFMKELDWEHQESEPQGELFSV